MGRDPPPPDPMFGIPVPPPPWLLRAIKGGMREIEGLKKDRKGEGWWVSQKSVGCGEERREDGKI